MSGGKVLDNARHGLPQHRERVYKWAILRGKQQHEFHWPEEVPMKPLSLFLDKQPMRRHGNNLALRSARRTAAAHEAMRRILMKGDDPWNTEYIIDVDNGFRGNCFMKGKCPHNHKDPGRRLRVLLHRAGPAPHS